MRPVSNQSSRFFATAKTRKSTSLNHITIENLKLCPIRDLTVTCTYNTSKNQYTISDNLKFPALLKNADTNANYEYIFYDAESFFTSIPVAETIEYVLNRNTPTKN